MRLKPNWTDYLHDYRRREFDRIFGQVPPGTFEQALELGAGDGFQSRLLAPLTKHLIATDFSPLVLKNPAADHLVNQVCDAEQVGTTFAPKQFDFVFTSSMLEHIPDPQRVLRGVHAVLKDDGLAVHIMPNPFWKFSNLATYYPGLALTVLELLTNRKLRSTVAQEHHHRSETEAGYFENNQKSTKRRIPFLRHLLPPPHGVSRHHYQEFSAFSRRRWVRELSKAGFDTVKVIRGPVTSGNALGWGWVRRSVESLGGSSVNAYVTVKRGQHSRFEKVFA